MPASPSSVLTLGFGAWGGAALLPTLGYGVGEAPAAPVAGRVRTATAALPARGVTAAQPARSIEASS